MVVRPAVLVWDRNPGLPIAIGTGLLLFDPDEGSVSSADIKDVTNPQLQRLSHQFTAISSPKKNRLIITYETVSLKINPINSRKKLNIFLPFESPSGSALKSSSIEIISTESPAKSSAISSSERTITPSKSFCSRIKDQLLFIR